MKFNDSINYAKKVVFHNKKQLIFSTIFFTLFLLVILASFTIVKGVDNYIKRNFEQNPSYRTIYIDNNYNPQNEISKEQQEVIRNFEHVLFLMNDDNYQTAVTFTEVNDTRLGLYPAVNLSLPKLSKGRNFNSEDEKVLICPEKLYNSIVKGDETTLEEYIDITKYLNKTIDIKYYSWDYESDIPKVTSELVDSYTIIGLYKNEDDYLRDSSCYTLSDNIEKINKVEYEGSNSTSFTILAFVDDYRNVETVVQKIKNLGYDASPALVVDEQLILSIKFIIGFICVITIIFSFINVIVYTTKSINNNKKDYGIMKAIGYSNKNLLLVSVCELLIISALSVIISAVIYSIISFAYYTLFQNKYLIYSTLDFSVSIMGIVVIIFLVLILPVLCAILSNAKIKKIDPIKIINESEE